MTNPLADTTIRTIFTSRTYSYPSIQQTATGTSSSFQQLWTQVCQSIGTATSIITAVLVILSNKMILRLFIIILLWLLFIMIVVITCCNSSRTYVKRRQKRLLVVIFFKFVTERCILFKSGLRIVSLYNFLTLSFK